ncbi:HAD hydrolase-like protein [Psychrobacillus glaciei]|uniref:HAD hydrolase-like protein n=1 Tax=Psychrobacillus glaciei TaxID=2283160 RepID=UPI001CEF6011|nr:HAD hydrolase-like protein [Psychrobacillus glaciei]
MKIELTSQGVELLDVFYCPHSKVKGCNCIKPQIGMIKQVIGKYPGINLGESFVIGDSAVDIELAIYIGIKGFGIGVGSN